MNAIYIVKYIVNYYVVKRGINMNDRYKKGYAYENLGFVSIDEIRDAYIGEDNGTSIERRQIIVAMTMVFAMSIMSVAVLLFISPLTIYPYVTMIIPASIIGIFMFNGLVFKERDASISKYMVVTVIAVYAGFIYFHVGGLSAVSAAWYVFVFVLGGLILDGRKRLVTLVTIAIAYILLFYLGMNNPNLIYTLDADKMTFYSAYSVIQTSAVMVVIILFQNRIAIKENARKEQLQKELSQNNEQLTAQNEEILAINENLNNATRRLNESLHSQKLFTASMNHELRAPLNGVLGCIQMLMGSDNLTESQREVLNASFHSANALIQIVNDLLDYAKIEAGEFEIIKNNFDLKDIINSSTMIFVNQIREKGLIFNKDIPDDMPCMLYGDGERIGQIMVNLISNAIKYTPSGSVTFGVNVENGVLKFCVKDTGDGIAEEAMSGLFDPFKRLDEGAHKKIRGTGLGLFVTHQLIEKMDGSITVDSELKVGSTFTVCIPVNVVDSSVTYTSVRDNKKKAENVSFKDAKLLCVDDSSVNLMVFEKVVKRATDADITVTDSGKAALELLKDNTYDVIFLDHQMPEMDGVETFKKIREMGITTPVVALTANAGNGSNVTYEEMGFDGFIAKPMKINEVMAMLAKIYASKRSEE